MQEHTHNGIVQALYITAVVLVTLNLLSYGAIELAKYPQTEWLSKTIGATLNFSRVNA